MAIFAISSRSWRAREITLRFKRGKHPRTGEPQWEARAGGVLFLIFKGEPEPSNSNELWICIPRIKLNDHLFVVSLKARALSQTQRRKRHRQELRKEAASSAA